MTQNAQLPPPELPPPDQSVALLRTMLACYYQEQIHYFEGCLSNMSRVNWNTFNQMPTDNGTLGEIHAAKPDQYIQQALHRMIQTLED